MDFLLSSDMDMTAGSRDLQIADRYFRYRKYGCADWCKRDGAGRCKSGYRRYDRRHFIWTRVDVTVKGGADKAMSTLDEAIEYVSGVRSRIGAFQNRLESAESSLSETSENMTGAYSNIMDTDMATEMTEYAAQNILDQAGISVLSQANDLPQQVLSLLSR